ncbi:hypothetical protein BT69DRAFT_1210222, partial [Atractiella rhizophila]
LMGQVSDTASNNDTMVSELKLLLLSFKGQEYHIRCLNHVLNLVAKVCSLASNHVSYLTSFRL